MQRVAASSKLYNRGGRFQFTLRRQEAIAGFVFILPFVAFFVVFRIWPAIQAVLMSFRQWEILMPEHPYIGLGNFRELVNDDLWWLSLRNTSLFAVLTVVGNTILSLIAALVVIQPIRFQTLYRVVFYAPVLLSVSGVCVIWEWILNYQFGVLNYFLSMVGIPPVPWTADPNIVIPSLSMVTIWWGFGFPMLVFMAGLQSIPEHLYEAAKIDGANAWQRFRFVTLPLLRPTILFVTVTQFIAHLQVFGQSFIITGGGPGRYSYTVIMHLYYTAWRFFRMGYGAAIAVALGIIMIILTLLQFYFLGQREEE